MISVTILVKNSSQYIGRVLNALKRFPEVIILDTGSQDTTLAIAATFANVKIHHHEFIGFGACRNIAASLATYDWILAIDSDEIATDELVDEILSLHLDPKCVYSISRHNEYRGKFIKGCGWYPDRVIRLYNRTQTRYSDALVHEAIITHQLKIVDLQAHLLHFPYGATDDFLAKMQQYSSLFAKQYAGKRKSSVPRAVLHGIFAFLKSYVLKRGVLLGGQGFEISAYNGITAYYKYLKLRDANL